MNDQLRRAPFSEEKPGACTLGTKKRRRKRPRKTIWRLLDDVSHDFRTPLTVINEYVSLLRDGLVGAMNSEQRRMLDVIADRADDLNNVVDDLLDAGKLGEGTLRVWGRRSRVADVVSPVRRSLMRKAAVKQIELQFDIPPDLPDVYCDADKIGRVIINLTVGILKGCSQPSHVYVWASFDKKRRQVVMGVTGNREEIGPEDLSATVRRPTPAGTKSSPKTDNLGRGLKIARDLVSLNLGEFSVKSQGGAGDTFWFSIPIADPTEILLRHVSRLSESPTGTSVLSLVTVMVVTPIDDHLVDAIDVLLATLLRPRDLSLQLDRSLWLMAVAREESKLIRFIERTQEMRESINRNRLGEPLPEIAMTPLGTWHVPVDSDRILEMVGALACRT